MTEEEKIKQELEDKFSYLKDAVVIKRGRRIFTDIPFDNFMAVFDFAIKQMQFSGLSAITGLDEGTTLGVIYHLAKEGMMLNLRIHVPREKPIIKSVMPYFSCAEIYERELVDLLGFQVEGLPAGRRYPLPDDWPQNQHPLRKDWQPDDS